MMAENKMAVHYLIDPRVTPDMPVEWTNFMLISHDDKRFYLHFFQAIPPVLGVGPITIEEAKQKIEEMGGSIPAACIARLVVDADKMEEMVSAFSDNWANWCAKFRPTPKKRRRSAETSDAK